MLCCIVIHLRRHVVNAGYQTLTTSFNHQFYWDRLYFELISYTNITIEQIEVMCYTVGTHDLSIKTFNMSTNASYSMYINQFYEPYWIEILSSSMICTSSQQKHNITFTNGTNMPTIVSPDSQGQNKIIFGIESTGILGLRIPETELGDTYVKNDDLSIGVGIAKWNTVFNYNEVICTTIYYNYYNKTRAPPHATNTSYNTTSATGFVYTKTGDVIITTEEEEESETNKKGDDNDQELGDTIILVALIIAIGGICIGMTVTGCCMHKKASDKAGKRSNTNNNVVSIRSTTTSPRNGNLGAIGSTTPSGNEERSVNGYPLSATDLYFDKIL